MITRKITDIIVHCSATPNGRFTSVLDVDLWHKERGFRRQLSNRERLNYAIQHCGYHGLFYTNGFYCSARHYDEWGAHVKGSNARSIGFCMIGTDRFTWQQWIRLQHHIIESVRLLADNNDSIAICETPEQCVQVAKAQELNILGHRDYSPDIDGDGQVERSEWLKTCPGFDVGAWFNGGMVPPAGGVL